MDTLASTLAEKITIPEQRSSILYSMRMRLVELCKEHHIWLADGRIYLENEDGRMVCKDTATNQETIIVWGGEEYILEFDRDNEQRRENFHFPAELNFKVRKKGDGQQEIFLGAQILRSTPENLVEALSEKSIRVVDIPGEERIKYKGENGVLGPSQKIVFGIRQEREQGEKAYSPCITLVMNDDNRSKISYDTMNDLSFTDLERGDTWYPDFSSVSEKYIVTRHGREYIEVNCWSAKMRRSKEHLLSRQEGCGKFEKHYLQVGSNSFEVMHLIGHNQAEIKFLNGMYTVAVDEHGNMKSKEQRYINVSGSSTFWYDLIDNKKLDHEPA